MGDSHFVDEISEEITCLQPDDGMLGEWTVLDNRFCPRVFKKDGRQRKGKGADIQMTIDILSNTYQNNLDAVYLISGDGDYIPVIEEVMRQGKKMYVAALSRPHVRLKTGRPVSQYAGNEGCVGLADAEPHA